MAITSWTSEGMTWGSLAEVKLSFPWRRNEAIRQALNERWLAVHGDVTGLPSILQNEVEKLGFILEFMQDVDTYLPTLYDDFTDITEYNNPNSSYWFYNDARILAAIGDGSFYPSDELDFTAEWSYQRYKILNVLRYHSQKYGSGNLTITDNYLKTWNPDTIWTFNGAQRINTQLNGSYGVRERAKLEISNMINGMTKDIYWLAFIHWPDVLLFNTWDNRDIYNNNLEHNKWALITQDTGLTGTTEKTSYYNNIDTIPTGGPPNPGAWRSYLDDVSSDTPASIIDYEFSYRDW